MRDKSRPAAKRPTQADYEALSEFRYLIRSFLHFSQTAAASAGLTPRQHQALLAIRGFAPPRAISVGDLAERLGTKHNSAVELVDRLVKARLVTRGADPSDQRRVLLQLTALAEGKLAGLSVAHLDELDRLEPTLRRVMQLRHPT
ncbi:MAG TPA: MarR family transcriptional regulator [Caulobacteraceae bacterium]|jgi:DNA-binding MarR family transcriptional regulator|nr:MarR family transcriptional regulator [Caulobacteraceae bacterium]